MQERNYYILLEVRSTATTEEIKIAYRILAKKYHPDKNIGNKASEEYFKEIQQAYAILSNPEKRKKYDLKFSQGTKTQTQQRTSSSGTQYAGNAYQYAQQQAQAKQQTRSASQKQQPSPDWTESWQILVSVGISLVLLYFIISYSTGNPNTANQGSVKKPAEFKSEQEIPSQPAINNFDSPYTAFFGEEISDSESKNNISIYNSDYSEAVVCLVENNPPHRTIRNQYMNSGTMFKMNAIPNGEYFLKIYYGIDWDPEKIFLNRSAKGGFKKENGFVELNTGNDILKMKQEKTGTSDSYSSFEIRINPEDNGKVKRISAEEFFMK